MPACADFRNRAVSESTTRDQDRHLLARALDKSSEREIRWVLRNALAFVFFCAKLKRDLNPFRIGIGSPWPIDVPHDRKIGDTVRIVGRMPDVPHEINRRRVPARNGRAKLSRGRTPDHARTLPGEKNDFRRSWPTPGSVPAAPAKT